MTMTTTLTLEETAKTLGLSKRTIYNRLKDGTLQSVRVGTSQRVTRESIAAVQKAKR